MPKRDPRELNVLIATVKGTVCKTVGFPPRELGD
jgi:hypothetical protein